MNHNVWHIALEPIPSRYSAQWLECIKPEFEKYAAALRFENKIKDDWHMIDILGDPISQEVTEGAFLDFFGTNVWKGTQTAKIARLFSKGYICPGDVFLFTDAWNPSILNVRYMADLMNIPVRIVSYWHAGSYDPWDFLGQNKNMTWAGKAEQAFYAASHHNVFATKFHAELFCNNLFGTSYDFMKTVPGKIVFSGQPHYQILEWFKQHKDDDVPKRDLILFPHRLVPEKNPEIFDALTKRMPEFEWVKTVPLNLKKEEYYNLMKSARIVFSASFQETLGITMLESVFANCLPMMPRRLSYPEIFGKGPCYPGEWAAVDQTNIEALEKEIRESMSFTKTEAFDLWLYCLRRQAIKYMKADKLWDVIVGVYNDESISNQVS
jgi:hypothetical protein